MSEIAYFGGGCFWCTEAIFQMLKGVISVTPGYAGGTTENPTYADVCDGNTGHAEVIKIEFDPTIIPFSDLLEIFCTTHNPTLLNRQGNDVGTQYRSIILYTNDKQKKEAEESLKKMSSQFSEPIVTEIKPLEVFFEAEDYHKDYYNSNPGNQYCEVVISPKLQHLREKYSNKLK